MFRGLIVDSLFAFILLVLGSFRITRFVVKDYLFSPVRDRIWDRFPPESTKLGYFFSCPWCVGFWSSLGVGFWYTIMPSQTLWFCIVLAMSTLVGWLTAFDDRI